MSALGKTNAMHKLLINASADFEDINKLDSLLNNNILLIASTRV